MMRCWMWGLLLPGLALAGPNDFYECVGADGEVSYSLQRCAKGQTQRRVEDGAAAENRSPGKGGGGLVRLESVGGHFYTTLRMNGVPIRVVVDTGATAIALSPDAARRMGLNPAKGRTVTTQTANGTANATAVLLDSVELQGYTVRSVPAVILGQSLGREDALLGMSFLRHFEVNTDGYQMTLRPK